MEPFLDTHYIDPIQKGFFNHEPHEQTRKNFYRVTALTNGMAYGLKSNATVPVVIDVCPPTLQEARCGSVGEKTGIGDRISESYDQHTLPNSKKSSCFFVSFVVKKPLYMHVLPEKNAAPIRRLSDRRCCFYDVLLGII
jgi:hypothetical protein